MDVDAVGVAVPAAVRKQGGESDGLSQKVSVHKRMKRTGGEEAVDSPLHGTTHDHDRNRNRNRKVVHDSRLSPYQSASRSWTVDGSRSKYRTAKYSTRVTSPMDVDEKTVETVLMEVDADIDIGTSTDIDVDNTELMDLDEQLGAEDVSMDIFEEVNFEDDPMDDFEYCHMDIDPDPAFDTDMVVDDGCLLPQWDEMMT